MQTGIPNANLRLETTIGILELQASQRGLRTLRWINESEAIPKESRKKVFTILEQNNPHLLMAIEQLQKYLKGCLKVFDLNFDLAGTPFQRQVWTELLRIPYGQTVTYGEIARRTGRPRAVRAVATAIGRNPIAIFIPCHRVIGVNGRLGGYAWGLPRKIHLLKLEGQRDDFSLFD